MFDDDDDWKQTTVEWVDGVTLYLILDQGLSLDYLGGHHGFNRLPSSW